MYSDISNRYLYINTFHYAAYKHPWQITGHFYKIEIYQQNATFKLRHLIHKTFENDGKLFKILMPA